MSGSEKVETPGAGVPRWPDNELVQRAVEGDLPAFELIMRRYNQRIYRTVYSVLLNSDEAEDVLQEAYTRAFHKLRDFTGHGSLGGWLSKIALHEAFARHREKAREVLMDDMSSLEDPVPGREEQTERVSSAELRAVLEEALAKLPPNLRTVFVLREVEELSTEETADSIGISPANVKVRLHRAKEQLRAFIDSRLHGETKEIYQFGFDRCDRLVRKVLAKIGGE